MWPAGKFPHWSPCGLPPGLLRRYPLAAGHSVVLASVSLLLAFCRSLGAQKCGGRRQRRSIRIELSVAL